MKRVITLAMVGMLSAFIVSPAFADQDDATWVAKCVRDNKDQGQSVETLTTYCTCMNSKMSSEETQSISSWEKTHSAENNECSKKAGWH